MDDIYKQFIGLYSQYYMYACYTSPQSMSIRKKLSDVANLIIQLEEKIDKIHQHKYNIAATKLIESVERKGLKSFARKVRLFTGSPNQNKNVFHVLK